MATRDAFSEEELARLRGFPEITRTELIRYFTLTEPDDTFVRQFRGPANILGAAVQLCTLPWLGFVPDDVHGAPALGWSQGETSRIGHRRRHQRDPARRTARCSHPGRCDGSVEAEPGTDLCFVVDVALAGNVDDDLVDGAAGEPERRLVVGGDR